MSGWDALGWLVTFSASGYFAWKIGHEAGFQKGFKHGSNKTVPLNRKIAELSKSVRNRNTDYKSLLQRLNKCKELLTPEQWESLHQGELGRRTKHLRSNQSKIQDSEPVWTTDKPTEPGWYWMRLDELRGLFLGEVYANSYGEMMLQTVFDIEPVETVNVEWRKCRELEGVEY